MPRRIFIALAILISLGSGLQSVAQAQVYRFDGDPYVWAKFGTTVIDQVVYRHLGNGQWRWDIQVVRASDGAVLQGFEFAGTFNEVGRGNGEVQLRRPGPNGVPVKLTDNGSYIFRTYPEFPVPDGINPNEKKWWRDKGRGRWIYGRPD